MLADMEDYGFEYSDEEPEEQDVDIENQYYNSKGAPIHSQFPAAVKSASVTCLLTSFRTLPLSVYSPRIPSVLLITHVVIVPSSRPLPCDAPLFTALLFTSLHFTTLRLRPGGAGRGRSAARLR